MTTTVGGKSSYAIAICDSQSGGNTPAGNILYINAEKVSLKWALKTTIEHQPGRQSFSIKDGNKCWTVSISNAKFTRDVTATYNDVMAELNGICHQIEDFTDINAGPVYLFIGNAALSESPVLKTFRDNTGTDRSYLKGYPTSFEPELEGMVSFVTGSINFEECWI